MAMPLAKTTAPEMTPAKIMAVKSGQAGSIWLDSNRLQNDWGRRSWLACAPVGELILRGNQATVAGQSARTIEADRNYFFDALDDIHRQQQQYAVGFISYEAALPWLGITPRSRPRQIPDAHFYLYDTIDEYAATKSGLHDLLPSEFEAVGLSATGESPACTPDLPRGKYLEAVEQIKEHIREGDIYQANFTCRFEVKAIRSPFETFLRLRRLNPAAYGAYLNFGDYQILSSSPERMFHLENGRLATSPIKGTIARGETEAETSANLERLLQSPKDRAELLMIVDLVRNDLGKIARTGSVTVERLFRPEVYSSLIHLIADISAEIKPDCCLSDVFKALLPGGSITGAPKRRAVEIIDQLEISQRSVYTGVIGYLGAGRADFNLAIRTMIHTGGCYQIHAGGGIVADSDPEAEYDEMSLKASNLFKATGVTR